MEELRAASHLGARGRAERIGKGQGQTKGDPGGGVSTGPGLPETKDVLGRGAFQH